MIVCGTCGTEDFYFAEQKGNFCAWCGKKIKPVPDRIFTFGKYKGRKVSTMKNQREINYLDWVIANVSPINKELKKAIENQLNIHT